MSDKLTGVKHDQDKLPWELVPWDALREVVSVLRFGKQKYSARNWENGIVYSRLYAAAIRHLSSWFQDGEDKDPETGISHLAHAACCTLFMLAFHVRGMKEVDDRPKVSKTAGPYKSRRWISATELMENHPDLEGLSVMGTFDLGVGKGIAHLRGTIVKKGSGDLWFVDKARGLQLRDSMVSLEVLSE